MIDLPIAFVFSPIREEPGWPSHFNGGGMALIKKTRTIEIPVEPEAEIPRGSLSIEEFAISQSLGRTVTCKLLQQGVIRSYKVGRRRLIPVSETVDFPARMLAMGEQGNMPCQASAT
jgi:excisionase family DNA binding protein